MRFINIKYWLIAFLLVVNATAFSSFAQNDESIIVNKPGLPFTFELNTGEFQVITRTYKGKSVKKVIKLKSFLPFYEPNYWFSQPSPVSFHQFQVDIEIDGKPYKLYHRAYQSPQEVAGLKIYVECVKYLDETSLFDKMDNMKKQVRFSVCLAGEPWGPDNIEFPINDYLWRAAVYNNTWTSLVPFNQIYYHRGEDYGAIPNKLTVVSPISGTVIASPLPSGDGKSNSIIIEDERGLAWRLTHLDIESVKPQYPVGTKVKTGTEIAKTGMTWDGRKSQHADPHLHVDIRIDGIKVGTFPYLMEAYQRKYKDPVVAIAGGYRFTVPGEEIELDATRSLTYKKSKVSYSWKLSNGKVANTAKTTMIYSEPGLYAEELIVKNKNGSVDRDFLYVRVYDLSRKNNIAMGWAYYYPIRNIKTGDKILFWNRLNRTTSDVKINFGDNDNWSVINSETTYSYSKPGRYVVILKSTGPGNEPVMLKMEVVVEK